MKAVTLCLAMLTFTATAGAEDVLWYEQPASEVPWKQVHRSRDWRMRCLPIGNGQLGGMIFAHPHQERIQFNEDTLWVGDEEFVGNSLPFADLYVEQAHAPYTHYRRQLDLARAVHTITYRSGGVNYKRQYFASHPDRAMVFHFTADQPGAHNGRVFLDDVYSDSEPQLVGNRITLQGDDAGGSRLQGDARDGATIEAQSLRMMKDKKRFNIRLARESQLRVLHKGGRIRIEDRHIVFENVDALTLLLTAGTDYINQRSKGWRGEHPHKRITADLDAASARSFDELLARHLADYRGLYERFDIHLGDTDPQQAALPTDERLAARVEGRADPELEAMLYQYARYLMIASSRPGTMPAHLQGIWNRSVRPAWWGDYHTDVNIQMCYWFVDKANLSECYEPYVSWLNSIREVRTELSRAEFDVRGWTFGAMNGPFGGSAYFNVKGVAAWCAQNLYDHYRFTQDEPLLRERIYPILKELCWFWEDLLKELPDGTLVSPDGFSPEHGPKHVDGVSFDQQWIWDLFTNTIEASRVLGVDVEWRKSLLAKRERLLAPKVGRWGQLQEWMQDIDDPKNRHRHISHLVALHPGRQIAPQTTPKLAAAAQVSLEARGEGRSAWAKVWRAIMWARLLDGQRAYQLLDRKVRNGHFNANLFSCHDPRKAFQIDGNFGWAEAVSEMLVQSHLVPVHLLPALPDAWPSGKVTGMRVRGGYEMDLQWADGRLVSATFRGLPRATGKLTVQYGDKKIDFDLPAGQEKKLAAGDF